MNRDEAGAVNKFSSDSPPQDIIAGNRISLARAITVVENNLDGRRKLFRSIQDRLGNAQVIGITGPPGVGKSTLIDACIPEFRKLGSRVAVLAIDPSSHISGGAILGDRVRMAQHAEDDGVFIRSIAARGHLGGLSSTAMNIVNLFDAAKWDTVIVETVGIGQSEIEISNLADITVLVESPGLGDEIQAIKSGILEIADIIVVNKSDLPQAEMAASHFANSVSLRQSDSAPQILNTVATTGEGIVELVAEICRLASALQGSERSGSAEHRVRRIVAKIVGERVENQLVHSKDRRIDECMKQINAGDIELDWAVEKMTRQLLKQASSS